MSVSPKIFLFDPVSVARLTRPDPSAVIDRLKKAMTNLDRSIEREFAEIRLEGPNSNAKWPRPRHQREARAVPYRTTGGFRKRGAQTFDARCEAFCC